MYEIDFLSGRGLWRRAGSAIREVPTKQERDVRAKYIFKLGTSSYIFMSHLHNCQLANARVEEQDYFV